MNEIIRFNVDYYPDNFSFSRNGSELYVGLFDLEDQLNVTANLTVVNTANWGIENVIQLPHSAVHIHTPTQNNIVYITCGHTDSVRISLLRIDTPPGGTVVRNNFGSAPASGITMNHDETKLYVFDGRIYEEFAEEFELIDTYHKMHIIDPDTLEILDSVRMDCYKVLQLIQGPPGFILLAHGRPIDPFPASLTVFDTTSDTVDRVIETPDYYGCRDLRYDATRNLVYAVAFQIGEHFDPELGFTVPRAMPTDRVLIFDLSTDQVSWSPVFPELVGQIALSPDGNRLYAGSAQPGSKKVFYMDIPSPPNQDPICVLDCPTLIMPEVLPVAVAFDASGSYDPDGDPITYHWDFNGDGIFDGVGDEYTGDPWNPTHQFMSYGIHEVSLKVMDDKDGECVETVVIEIVES